MLYNSIVFYFIILIIIIDVYDFRFLQTVTAEHDFNESQDADTGDRDGKVETDLGLNGKPKKKHSLFNNIFRLRFVTSLIKKFLQIFISDPDITSIVSRLLSWVIWSYVVLSIMGTCGVGEFIQIYTYTHTSSYYLNHTLAHIYVQIVQQTLSLFCRCFLYLG